MRNIKITKDIWLSDLPEHDTWHCGRHVWNQILDHTLNGTNPLQMTIECNEELDPGVVHLYLRGELVREVRIYR